MKFMMASIRGSLILNRYMFRITLLSLLLPAVLSSMARQALDNAGLTAAEVAPPDSN